LEETGAEEAGDRAPSFLSDRDKGLLPLLEDARKGKDNALKGKARQSRLMSRRERLSYRDRTSITTEESKKEVSRNEGHHLPIY